MTPVATSQRTRFRAADVTPQAAADALDAFVPHLLRGSAGWRWRRSLLRAGAFSTIYSVDRDVFAAGATAEQRPAAARVHLPTFMAGCGLCSAVTTSDAAYVAAW